MTDDLSLNAEKIARLYYLSGTFSDEPHQLSVHRDDPTHDESPFYLHYPRRFEKGYDLLPELFKTIGIEFADMFMRLEPPKRPKLIIPTPDGATPLAKTTMEHLHDYPAELVEFEKTKIQNAEEFVGPISGEYLPGDTAVNVEDHVSGGRNAERFHTVVTASGILLTHMFVVVDRQQGAVARLDSLGADLHSILTSYKLLNYGAAEGFITTDQRDEFKGYIDSHTLYPF